MAERVYIALDLETTGLDAKRDAIIEIGAVRFQGNRILDRYVTFVNPLRTIPLRVQQITNIRNSDVADAPLLDAVIPELLRTMLVLIWAFYKPPVSTFSAPCLTRLNWPPSSCPA